MEKKYKIVRMYFDDNISARTVKTDLSFEEAVEHCKDPETSSKTCTKRQSIEHTELFGEWFDGFDEM